MIQQIGPSEFGQMREKWNTLLQASRSDSLFLTWEWLHTWWTHFSPGRELRLLGVRAAGELRGLLPLALAPASWTRFRPRSLELLGSGAAGADYLDFIVPADHEEEVLAEAADYFLRQRIALNLLQQDYRRSCAARLTAYWRECGASVRQSATNVCPVIDLEGHTWDSYLATLGAEHRYNFRRKLKHLTKQFDVRFETVPSEGERSAALERVVRLHHLRRISLGGSDAFHTPALVAFHEELTRIALERGWLRLLTLWLDEQPAAALYGFLYNRTFYFYQTGFDPQFGGLSVGLVLMGLAIRSAIDEGAREYDLLHGAERYKFHWASRVRELSGIELYPLGARGELWKSARQSNQMLRAMARKVLSTTRTRAVEAVVHKGGTGAYASGRG